MPALGPICSARSSLVFSGLPTTKSRMFMGALLTLGYTLFADFRLPGAWAGGTICADSGDNVNQAKHAGFSANGIFLTRLRNRLATTQPRWRVRSAMRANLRLPTLWNARR